jgi:hypothetical protein
MALTPLLPDWQFRTHLKGEARFVSDHHDAVKRSRQ